MSCPFRDIYQDGDGQPMARGGNICTWLTEVGGVNVPMDIYLSPRSTSGSVRRGLNTFPTHL